MESRLFPPRRQAKGHAGRTGLQYACASLRFLLRQGYGEHVRQSPFLRVLHGSRASHTLSDREKAAYPLNEILLVA